MIICIIHIAMQTIVTPQKFHRIIPEALTIRSNIGCLTQVRNHVKIYPWRTNRNNPYSHKDNTETPYTDRHNINEFNIAKRQKKPWQLVIPKDKDHRFNAYKWNDSYRSDPVEARQTAEQKLKSLRDSISHRGAAREAAAYSPPESVEERILKLCRESAIGDGMETITEEESLLAMDLNQNRSFKFKLIVKCIDEFDHDLPNSYLNDMVTVRDLVDYYLTPVRGVNPYDALLQKTNSLPENLHLISEPLRYDRENDEVFDGYSALPGIVSKVPGLRGARKYPVLNQDEFQWPDI